MNAPHEPVTRPAPASRPVRRITATAIMSGLVFGLGACRNGVLDAIAAVVFGVLGAIAAFFGAIFSLFGS